MEHRVLPYIERVIANSQNTQNRLRNYLNVDSNIIHPGVDLEKHYCKEYNKTFLIPGRITPEKRLTYGVSAFKKFLKTHPDWNIVIAGSLMEERKRHVKYFNTLSSIMKNGTTRVNISEEEMNELYANCYSVIYTPIDEDFGIVPLEAMASSKPVIGVNEGGLRETVVNGETGYLVESVQEMVERMSLLADNYDLNRQLGENGRRRVEEHFSWHKFFEGMEDEFTECIGETIDEVDGEGSVDDGGM
jgi:glycosyltransferase involved in cell wall biosynthesis